MWVHACVHGSTPPGLGPCGSVSAPSGASIRSRAWSVPPSRATQEPLQGAMKASMQGAGSATWILTCRNYG
eukprot:15480278-Alexandrium_andersonii.AAC.1